MSTASEIRTALRWIQEAQALIITAGAGMGVDGGLPDFRGPEGFWRAYPTYAQLGHSFESLAQPRWFADDPALAWGFYGHRLSLYRQTQPHAGYDILHRLSQRIPTWVITSNVDGHFQRQGFKHVWEVHGSIHHAQCHASCCGDIWPIPMGYDAKVDDHMRASFLHHCPHCNGWLVPISSCSMITLGMINAAPNKNYSSSNGYISSKNRSNHGSSFLSSAQERACLLSVSLGRAILSAVGSTIDSGESTGIRRES